MEERRYVPEMCKAAAKCMWLIYPRDLLRAVSLSAIVLYEIAVLLSVTAICYCGVGANFEANLLYKRIIYSVGHVDW